ncbi:autotransporter outer membrane beta-barrel domain-containing protein, partial [Escherichia coli]|nr:autotransporter outer membrane beta-barrel domain-containing protein [Escherichia coli]EET9964241.1 autotransporter outer membrane beta-barrel domain-containing protein [Escherichia coli]EFE3656339.1 autotransporter outer membrane beta-barrel domain-containing protein [Escherichia coli]EFG6258496.1 autotransporter outer membrane beta-barrel domain-containing protein [Escherichia coli]EFI0036319.1 autotransporter outer membrane beta-barrel domain-containing protein [Escherichia coli]
RKFSLQDSRGGSDITKNMGAYASLDYTKGDDIENPLQGVVGINVTW